MRSDILSSLIGIVAHSLHAPWLRVDRITSSLLRGNMINSSPSLVLMDRQFRRSVSSSYSPTKQAVGLSVRTEQWRYTQWFPYDRDNNIILFDKWRQREHSEELYAHEVRPNRDLRLFLTNPGPQQGQWQRPKLIRNCQSSC